MVFFNLPLLHKLFLLFIHTDTIVLHSLSLLNRTPLRRCAKINVFFLLLMGSWVISSVFKLSIRKGASKTILAHDLGVHGIFILLCHVYDPNYFGNTKVFPE